MIYKISQLVLTLNICLLLGCSGNANTGSNSEPDKTSVENKDLGIEAVPESLGAVYLKNFNRYTSYKTKNGGAIHIVAQNDITDEQIVRCKSILEHFLRDYPGSEFGDDKSEIANKMAENNAVLVLLNGQDELM